MFFFVVHVHVFTSWLLGWLLICQLFTLHSRSLYIIHLLLALNAHYKAIIAAIVGHHCDDDDVDYYYGSWSS